MKVCGCLSKERIKTVAKHDNIAYNTCIWHRQYKAISPVYILLCLTAHTLQTMIPEIITYLKWDLITQTNTHTRRWDWQQRCTFPFSIYFSCSHPFFVSNCLGKFGAWTFTKSPLVIRKKTITGIKISTCPPQDGRTSGKVPC